MTAPQSPRENAKRPDAEDVNEFFDGLVRLYKAEPSPALSAHLIVFEDMRNLALKALQTPAPDAGMPPVCSGLDCAAGKTCPKCDAEEIARSSEPEDAGMPPEPMVEPGTPLPWRVGNFPTNITEQNHQVMAGDVVLMTGNYNFPENALADAAYIVHACNRLPKLEADYALLKSYIQRQGKEKL